MQPRTIREFATDTTTFLTSSRAGKGISIAAGAFLAVTFAMAVYRTYQKYTSTPAQRKRQIDKNKQLVEELSNYLPAKRDQLSPGVVRVSSTVVILVVERQSV